MKRWAGVVSGVLRTRPVAAGVFILSIRVWPSAVLRTKSSYHRRAFVEMCIVSCCFKCISSVSMWAGSAPGGCPHRRPPCRRASPAPLYRTNDDWLSFGWLVRGRMSCRRRKPLCSRAVAGLSSGVCVGSGPVLACRAPTPPAAARPPDGSGVGSPLQIGPHRSLVGVGPVRGLPGGRKKRVV